MDLYRECAYDRNDVRANLGTCEKQAEELREVQVDHLATIIANDRASREACAALAESESALAAEQQKYATCVQERQRYQFNLTRTRNGANLLREQIADHEETIEENQEQIDELNLRLEKQLGVIDTLKKQLEEANKK